MEPLVAPKAVRLRAVADRQRIEPHGHEQRDVRGLHDAVAVEVGDRRPVRQVIEPGRDEQRDVRRLHHAVVVVIHTKLGDYGDFSIRP